MIPHKKTKECFNNRILYTGIIIILLFAGPVELKAQEDPPRPPSISVTGNLSFGAFYHGTAGGTVIISPAGGRTSTGDVVLLSMGYSYSPARFNINSNAGTIINILNGPDVQLIWSGFSMNLHIGTSLPASPFVNTNPYSVPTELTVGATLTVGNSASNPPGTYTGSFNITLVVE